MHVCWALLSPWSLKIQLRICSEKGEKFNFKHNWTSEKNPSISNINHCECEFSIHFMQNEKFTKDIPIWRRALFCVSNIFSGYSNVKSEFNACNNNLSLIENTQEEIAGKLQLAGRRDAEPFRKFFCKQQRNKKSPRENMVKLFV